MLNQNGVIKPLRSNYDERRCRFVFNLNELRPRDTGVLMSLSLFACWFKIEEPHFIQTYCVRIPRANHSFTRWSSALFLDLHLLQKTLYIIKILMNIHYIRNINSTKLAHRILIMSSINIGIIIVLHIIYRI